jgi:hypothetical protein
MLVNQAAQDILTSSHWLLIADSLLNLSLDTQYRVYGNLSGMILKPVLMVNKTIDPAIVVAA